MITRRQAIELGALAALAWGPSARAAAQPAVAWPSRFVRLIVPFPPGGGTDAIARVVAGKLSDIWGQQVVVENRGGGATNIGTEAVVRSDPDGYTILITSMPLAVNRFLFPTLTYDPVEDIAPISLICEYPNIMAVPITSPARSVTQFIAYARANPGKVNMASAGNGSAPHMAGELFKMMTGVNMVHVPYRGQGPAMTDLLGGQVQILFAAAPGTADYIKTGKLRALAVTSATRMQEQPEIPSVGDFVPGYEASQWYGFAAPKNTPAEIVDRLNKEINAGIADPGMKARLAAIGGETMPGSPSDFGTLIAEETEKWGKVVRAGGLKPE